MLFGGGFSSHVTAVLTSVETHPTRPELLITGSDDGRVSFWDQRRLDAPFRTEIKHQRAGTKRKNPSDAWCTFSHMQYLCVRD